jgi:hypothetical protein
VAGHDRSVVPAGRRRLREHLGALPQGDTLEDLEAMEVIWRAAKALKEAP